MIAQETISTDVSVARGLLDREDLLERLDRAVAKRVTVISAPPGSGKTSLLRAWAERAAGLRRVAFVSVERDQQDAARFWGAVLDAVRRPERSIGTEAEPAATAALDPDELVDRTLSEVAEQIEPVVLIIDDLHELRAADALTQLEHLLAALPSSSRVVLSSRRDPAIKLHRLRLADEVAEIRAGDLRFTERETRELLATSGIGLSDAGALALHQRTEGWAAGLRLAVISLSGHPDPERFVAEFSGTDRAIGEYLMAEMLERQPSEVQRMLLRTSLVDRVNGELADLLAGRTGSEQMLLELEDANAFVVSLDARRTWFRYHQLLADFLRLELRRTMADEVPDLHRRAARWFADKGDVVEAVRHTLAAGDWPDASQRPPVADPQPGFVAQLPRVRCGDEADPCRPCGRPGFAHAIARRISDLDPPRGEDRDAWDIEVVSEPFTTGLRGCRHRVGAAAGPGRQHEWDLVVGLTELPLRDDDGRYLLVETDPQRRTAVLSLPALGGVRMQRAHRARGAQAGHRHGRPRLAGRAPRATAPASVAAGGCCWAWCSPTVRGCSCPGSSPRSSRPWQPAPSPPSTPRCGCWPAPCRGGVSWSRRSPPSRSSSAGS